MPVIKPLVKNLLNRFGYNIHRINAGSTLPDAICASTVRESLYYTKYSTPYPLFTPWAGYPDFDKVYEGVASLSLVTADRCYILAALARYARHLEGDFAECGVYKGGTALLLCRVLADSDKTLHLFDSFEGLPEGNPQHDNYYGEGDFSIDSVGCVSDLLNRYSNQVKIYQGWIPDTFDGLGRNQYSLAHIDVDLYQSALDCCEYFYPRLVAGGVLVFDDYGFPSCRGEKDAVDQFFADKLERPIVLPTGQALVLKI